MNKTAETPCSHPLGRVVGRDGGRWLNDADKPYKYGSVGLGGEKRMHAVPARVEHGSVHGWISTFPGSPAEASLEFVGESWAALVTVTQCNCIVCLEHTRFQAHQTKLSVSQLPPRGGGDT